MVMVTTIPHEREWTQWKGRTARQDRNGQFAVFLSRMKASKGDSVPDPVLEDVTFIEESVPQGEDVVEQMLRSRDKEVPTPT